MSVETIVIRPTVDVIRVAQVRNVANEFTPHGHDIDEVDGLQTELDGKASVDHIHDIADVTGLQAALDAAGVGGGAVDSVNGQTGVVVLAKADVGLGNVDNTSDASKPISTATQTALDGKADIIHTQAISTVTGLQAALDLKAPLDNPTLTRAQIATGTITADTPALNITQIWNNASIAFNAINLEITNTASAAASNFIKCQLPSGTTLFKVDKSGFIYGPGVGYVKLTGSAFSIAPAGTVRGGMDASGGFGVSSGGWIGFSSLSSADPSSGLNADVVLVRDAPNTLATRNGLNPQTVRIYGTFASAGADYERLSLSYNGSAFLIQNEAGGTGLAREVVLNSTSALRFQFSGGTKCIIGSGSTQFYQAVSSTASIISSTWLRPGSYTVAGVPSAASAGAGAQIYVSNESGGAVLAFSDGTDWRRVTDRAIIS